jgi:beta-N-acetylhexosaminidase
MTTFHGLMHTNQEHSTISARAAVATVTKNYEKDPLLAVDHEGGSVQRFNGEGFSILPSWQSLCALSSSDRRSLLSVSAKELQSLGIDIVFGPVIDLSASGSALRTRACGSDAEFVSPRAAEYIEVFSEKGILPVVKHFPGIGAVTRDLHNFPATIGANENELTVYQYLLSEHPNIGVMMAHVSVEKSLGGEVCSLSTECVQGFKGLFTETIIFSDALEMKSAAFEPNSDNVTRSLAKRAELAALAGNNVLVFGPDVTSAQLDEVLDSIVQKYERDSALKTEIDTSAELIFQLIEERT